MLNYNNTILAKIDAGQKQAAADAERAKALQADATFWAGGEVPDADDPIPLWQAICIFKGTNPAHWLLTTPAYAERMQLHTMGDVAERLKELLRLHGKALGHIETGKLQVSPDVSNGFRTTLEWVTEWAVLVGKAPPDQCSAPDAISGQSTAEGLRSDEKMSKKGLIKAHDHQWPSIEADINQAAKNGLVIAKAGKRGWYEDKALKWARNNGKIVESRSPTSNSWYPS